MKKPTRLPFVEEENSIPLEHQQRLLDIKKEHFHMNQSFQVVSSDDMAFLISQLYQLYFPSESNVSYTKECKTSNT